MYSRKEFNFDVFKRACYLLGRKLPSYGHGHLRFVCDHRSTLDRCWDQDYSVNRAADEVAKEVNAMNKGC